jgi:hypothetical protein
VIDVCAVDKRCNEYKKSLAQGEMHVRAPAKQAFTEPWRKTATDTRKSPADTAASAARNQSQQFLISRFPAFRRISLDYADA